MEDFVKNLAAGEGWTDATTVGVLARALEGLVGMGLDRDDIEAIIRREGGVGEHLEDDGPEEGDVVRMRKQETTIIVSDVPEGQPERDAGIWHIVDQYGGEHRIERDGVDDPWFVVVDGI